MALIHDFKTVEQYKNITWALFIYNTGAFNNVSKVYLLQIMAKFRLPQEIINQTNNFMID
jgi:hypothetical protein